MVFSLFVLIGNPLIVMAIMGYMGYRKRTGMLAGLTVAQISEFSLIFVAMGISLGHVGKDALGLVTLVGLVTIALSVYMITYSQYLYQWLEPVLGMFERRIPHREEAFESQQSLDHPHDVILLGIGRYGAAIMEILLHRRQKILAIDFNPEIVRHWQGKGIEAIYGDALDHEFLSSLPLRGVKWVVSTLSHHDVGVTHVDPRISLIEGLHHAHFTGKIVVATHHPQEIETLRTQGVDLVLCPFVDAAHQAVNRILGDAGSDADPIQSLPERR